MKVALRALKWFLIISSGLVAVFVLLSVIYAVFFVETPEPISFDSKLWKQHSSASSEYDGEFTNRQQMYQDLKEKYLESKSLQESEVSDLLGPSDSGRFEQLEYDYLYQLGSCGIDHEWLALWFDDAGNLEEYRFFCD